jgi:hypothetical protein
MLGREVTEERLVRMDDEEEDEDEEEVEEVEERRKRRVVWAKESERTQ